MAYISNAEINEILASRQSVRHWTTEGSDIMVYDDTEWVAWMSEDTKKKRSVFYDEYNFAGTTDWAVDLQSFVDGTGEGDDDNEYIDPNWFSSCKGAYYQTLEQLESMKDKIPIHCMDIYILDLQITLYEEALKKYKGLINNGYDKKFEVYKKFVEDQVPDQINNFMATDKVDKYFKCKEYKYIKCCSSCQIPQCREDCSDSPNCRAGNAQVDMDKCPKMEFEDKGLDVDQNIPNATFTLTDSDGFYKDLADTWGIEESWIRFDKRLMHINNGCQYAGRDVLACQLQRNNYFWNYPMGNANIEVYNPKKIIRDSYPKATEMLNSFKFMQTISLYNKQIQMLNLVDAISIPTFALEEAVESMRKIIEKADEITKKECEEAIVNFVTSLLFFIPVGGEVAGAVGATTIRSLLRLVGAVGEAALTLYDVVENPQNALISIFTYLAGVGVRRSGFRNAANARRSISPKDYASLGNVKVKLDTVEGLRGKMCKI